MAVTWLIYKKNARRQFLDIGETLLQGEILLHLLCRPSQWRLNNFKFLKKVTADGSLAQGVLILTEQYFHSRKPAGQSDFSSWKWTCESLLEKFKIASKRETIYLGLSSVDFLKIIEEMRTMCPTTFKIVSSLITRSRERLHLWFLHVIL